MGDFFRSCALTFSSSCSSRLGERKLWLWPSEATLGKWAGSQRVRDPVTLLARSGRSNPILPCPFTTGLGVVSISQKGSDLDPVAGPVRQEIRSIQ